MKTKLKIGKAWIEHKQDENPDTSWIGEFTDELSDNAIIRIGEHKGKTVAELNEGDEIPERGREYRFFVPAMTGEETGNMESPKQDWERYEALNRRDWSFIGITAKCELLVPLAGNPGIYTVQRIHSGGLWGIESDSGPEYIAEVERDELSNLRTQLEAFGLGDRAITHAFKTVYIVEK